MEFIVIAIIFVYILESNKKVSTKKFIDETEPYFRFLMEEDYKFLVGIRYGADVNIDLIYSKRVRDGIVTIIAMVFFFLSRLNFLYLMLSFIIGYVSFKMPYMKLKKYYKSNLHYINQMLPYYLKSLEILAQHYTIPVALSRSINTAPDVFKPGLKRLIEKIDSGDSSVDPYMDFAKEYPVRDSMRMMRLLYRLGLGSQENKQEQLMIFSKTVSTLQNKAREQKYQARLEKMENQTMIMLGSTGGGIMLLMLLSMMMLMNL